MNDESTGTTRLAIVGMLTLAVVGALAFVFLRKDKAATDTVASAEVLPGAASTAPPPPAVTRITFMYSTEKKAWLAEALARFSREHPQIAVDALERGSLDMVQSVLEQQQQPTLLSPADDVALNLLTSDWRQKHRSELIDSEGPHKVLPLVLTPLVLVAWEDRGTALAGQEKAISFRRLRDAIASPKGWPSVGGKAEWGFVKLGHTNPTRSNSGLQALILMAYDFHEKRSGLEVGDVLSENFQAFLKAVEKGVPKFGDSTGTVMEEMVLYGPSKYDVVIAYENLAIQHVTNAQGRWGNLRVLYPSPTMWSSHPVAVLNANWVTAEQRAAAQKLIGFLRDRSEQERALALGFRPANPAVPVVAADGSSPFKKAETFGVRVDLGSVVEPPPGPVIRNLLELWSRQLER